MIILLFACAASILQIDARDAIELVVIHTCSDQRYAPRVTVTSGRIDVVFERDHEVRRIETTHRVPIGRLPPGTYELRTSIDGSTQTIMLVITTNAAVGHWNPLRHFICEREVPP